MGDFVQNCIRDGSLVLYHDYRSGTALDWSGNGKNGVLLPLGTVFTGKGLRVFSVNPAEALGTTAIDLSGTAECSLLWKCSTLGDPFNTCLTMPSNWAVVFDSIFLGSSAFGNKRAQISVKGDVGYTSWVTATYETPPDCVFSASLNKALPAANEVVGYINGAQSGAILINSNNTNNFGNNSPYAGKSATTSHVGNIESFMIFNRALSAAEHFQLHREIF